MSLHFRQAGQGQPLILIHGLFGSLENLGALARPLAEEFQVFSLDLPNHGRSPHSDQMDLPSMAEQLREWMDQQQLAQAHILGHSLGGKVAMELALTAPERVDKLVTVDIAPVHYPPHHNAVFDGLLAVDPNQLKSRSEADQLIQDYVPELPVRSFLLKNLVKDDKGFSWRMNLPVIHAQYPHLISGNCDGRFDGKTLFIKGGNSDYIQEKHRDDILKRFPNASVKVVPDTGHWLHAEKPDLVARMVRRFLADEN